MFTLLLFTIAVNKIDTEIYNAVDRIFYQDHSFSYFDLLNQGISFTSGVENSFITLTSYGIYEGKNLYDFSLLYSFFLGNEIFIGITKYLINRKRPDGTGYRFTSSFPSGHTANAFFIATLFSFKDRRIAIPMYVWAFSCGFSRIYLKKHWFLDVVAGAIIGSSFGFFASKI